MLSTLQFIYTEAVSVFQAFNRTISEDIHVASLLLKQPLDLLLCLISRSVISCYSTHSSYFPHMSHMYFVFWPFCCLTFRSVKQCRSNWCLIKMPFWLKWYWKAHDTQIAYLHWSYTHIYNILSNPMLCLYYLASILYNTIALVFIFYLIPPLFAEPTSLQAVLVIHFSHLGFFKALS